MFTLRYVQATYFARSYHLLQKFNKKTCVYEYPVQNSPEIILAQHKYTGQENIRYIKFKAYATTGGKILCYAFSSGVHKRDAAQQQHECVWSSSGFRKR